MLSQHAPSLAAFDNQVNGKLTQPRHYADRYLGTIAVKLPHLSVLNIAGHTNISHEGYMLIAKHMANLEVLILPKQPYKAEWIGFLDLVESYLHKLISLLGIDYLELTGRIFKTVTYIQTSGNILMHDTEITNNHRDKAVTWVEVKVKSQRWYKAHGLHYFHKPGFLYFENPLTSKLNRI